MYEYNLHLFKAPKSVPSVLRNLTQSYRLPKAKPSNTISKDGVQRKWIFCLSRGNRADVFDERKKRRKLQIPNLCSDRSAKGPYFSPSPRVDYGFTSYRVCTIEGYFFFCAVRSIHPAYKLQIRVWKLRRKEKWKRKKKCTFQFCWNVDFPCKSRSRQLAVSVRILSWLLARAKFEWNDKWVCTKKLFTRRDHL